MEQWCALIKVTIMSSLQHGQGRCINIENLTDAIVEDMINRVANCNDQVQAVFLGFGLVCLSVCMYAFYMSVHLSVCMCVCMFVCVCQPVHQSGCGGTSLAEIIKHYTAIDNKTLMRIERLAFTISEYIALVDIFLHFLVNCVCSALSMFTNVCANSMPHMYYDLLNV